jgi:acetylornithine deacetylase
MKDVQHFSAQLIDIPSITGEEQKVSSFLKDFLVKKGMSVKLMPVANDRHNVYAAFSEDADVILTTHMDTVAPYIPARLENGILYGRGACDAKGIMAAMVYALFGLEKELQNRTGLLFVVGEEVDSIGAKTAAKSGLSPRYFINGEPTENKLVHAQKGTCLFEVNTKGKAAHSGYPEYGSSAIDILLQYLDRLKNYSWPENEILGKTLLNIGKLTGGEAINTLASSAQAECCIRVVSSARDVESILNKLLIDGVEIKIYSASDPVQLYCPHEIKETINVNYGSDVFYLQSAARVLMLGPGTILNAHTEDEHILVSELNEAIEKYRQLIRILVKKND